MSALGVLFFPAYTSCNTTLRTLAFAADPREQHFSIPIRTGEPSLGQNSVTHAYPLEIWRKVLAKDCGLSIFQVERVDTRRLPLFLNVVSSGVKQRMARKKLECPECDRKFALPAHLGRHMNSIHGAGGAKKSMGSPSIRKLASQSMSTGAGRVLGEMQAYLRELAAQRNAIDAQITGIENAMRTLGQTSVVVPGLRKRGRPKGSGGQEGSLKFMIVKVLKAASGPLSPREISAAVLDAGYSTTARNLTKAVSNALPEMPVLKRKGRGQYTV